MPAMPAEPASMPEPRRTGLRRLAVRSNALDSRRQIEAYVERLNHGSQVAERRIERWGGGPEERLCLGAVMAPGSPADAFVAEAEISFGLDVRAERPAAGTVPFSVGLVLAGSMAVTTAAGEHLAGPGQGVIVDPAAVERTRLAPGSHFVEFALPRQTLQRLRPEATLHFEPLLRAELAQRLLQLATRAGHMLHQAGPVPTAPALHGRWQEALALALLQGQAPAVAGGAAPARLRRALDFIEAQAHRNIELADIAEAAHLSASSLLRLFRQQLGSTPGAVLRGMRLDRARAELARGDAGSVREVAERWGFLNGSKFSQAYARRFGEQPRETRRRG